MAKAMKLDTELYNDHVVHDNAVKNPDAFGVEVELEGRGLLGGLDPKIAKFFTTHEDGSLRVLREDAERTEYVFKEPLNYADTMIAVKGLMDYLNSDKAEVFDSYRTSIHVHVNFAKETYRTIYNFITLSLIFDELFVSRCAGHRIGNNFCLRARDAQYQVIELMQSIESHGSIWGIGQNHRYSSINFASLAKFGTIEFRALECTTDFKKIKRWIDTLVALKNAAKTFVDPRDVIKGFSQQDMTDFVSRCLGDNAEYFVVVPEWNRMVIEGMRLAQDFAYCSEWKAQMPKAKPEPAKLKPAKPMKINAIGPAAPIGNFALYQQAVANAIEAGHPNPWQYAELVVGMNNQAQPIPQPVEPAVPDEPDFDDFFEEDNEPVDYDEDEDEDDGL